MSRRSLSITLLAILAVQFLGAIVLASVCLEPCPDDAEESSCPPVCALCTTCTQSTSAIVSHGTAGASLLATQRYLSEPAAAKTSQLAADIFHVPLRG